MPICLAPNRAIGQQLCSHLLCQPLNVLVLPNSRPLEALGLTQEVKLFAV